METILHKSITVSGADLKQAYRERQEFEADRWGHNDPRGAEICYSRITYMAHAGGYVMARRPGATPFVISEKLWRSFALFTKSDV